MTTLARMPEIMTAVERDPALDRFAAAVARRTIQRVADNPLFLGSAFARFQKRYGVDEAALARFLDCPIQNLPRLALAKRFDPAMPEGRFVAQCIAAANGADTERLASVLED